MNPININNIVTNREFLVENEKFKTLFFKFEDGKGLPNHSHNGYATIQVVSGTVDIEFKDGEKVLRAKIDMSSPNINFRDPVIYRIAHSTHHNTGVYTQCMHLLIH